MTAISAADFEFVREFIFAESAIALEAGKAYLVESRLDMLARKVGLASASEVVAALRDTPKNGLHAKVVDVMTTNETSFFRDAHVFEALTKQMLASHEGALDIWSAACSSGQEPYSIAMQLEQALPHLLPQTRILSTDLSPTVLAAARAGLYSTMEVNRGLPATLLARHFSREGLKWRFNPTLAECVDFRWINLATKWTFVGSYDVVFLRNVLIYFDSATKRDVLKRMRSVLKPGGILILGAAETTLHLDPAYKRVSFGRSIAYQLDSSQV